MLNLAYSLVTPQLAQQAIRRELPALEADIASGLFERPHLHIMVGLVRGYKQPMHPMADALASFTDITCTEHCLVIASHSIGRPDEWEYDFQQIALGKAELTAKHRMPSREVLLGHPELIVPGDIKYWGSAYKNGVVVSMSGPQSVFDEESSWKVLTNLGGLTADRTSKQIEDDAAGYFFKD